MALVFRRRPFQCGLVERATPVDVEVLLGGHLRGRNAAQRRERHEEAQSASYHGCGLREEIQEMKCLLLLSSERWFSMGAASGCV